VGRELRVLLTGLMVAFVIVGLAAAYWAAPGRDALLGREDNPRLVEARAAIQRGAIYDRSGELLALSEPVNSRLMARRYLHPETYSAVGYYSLRYGAGGLEADYDTLLSGLNQPVAFEDVILQHPTVGSDIRVTLDAAIQATIVEAMGGRSGAVMMMEVPSGNVLTSVSLPTYNSNTLDEDWETLRDSADNPFFNRARQGRYQPGGALQTPLMAALLPDSAALDETYIDAAFPVQLDDLLITCAATPAENALTLAQAYTYGCPARFAALADDAPQTLDRALSMIAALTPQQPVVTTPTPSPTPTEALNLVERLLGQGSETANPQSMMMLAAAILHDGNAPQPNTLLQTRAPNADVWQPVGSSLPSIPVMTQDSAQGLQTLMRSAVAEGAASAAARDGIDIGGHATLAYTGEGTLVWFIGFSETNANTGYAVVVVLEDERNPATAADIGGTALAAAQSAARP
jgi:penicillin-binding protein A